jgi:hypothetical protein
VGIVVFLAIMLAVLAMIHLYLWQRLVRDTARPGWRRRSAGLGLLAGALLVLAAVLLAGPLPGRFEGWLAGPGYLWLGIMFYLLMGLLVLELPAAAVRLGQRRRARRTGAPPDPGRRLLLRRGAAVAAGVAAAGVSGYGVWRAYAPPEVKRLRVPLARLDPRADGLRVAVIADLHVGPLYGRRQVERVVEIVNSLDPDLVAMVGDLASTEAGAVARDAAPLRRMRSRYGSFFVTGNHEYYHGYEEWLDVADEFGLRVLRNQRVEITHRGGAIDLAGVNDREGGRYDDPPDYEAALADRDPARPVLLLAHQPVQVHRAAAYGVDLQLSGHTHGGQLFPFDALVRLEQPMVSGLATIDGTQVYVTNGAGFWGPPMRVGAAPDVTLLELVSRRS